MGVKRNRVKKTEEFFFNGYEYLVIFYLVQYDSNIYEFVEFWKSGKWSGVLRGYAET